jgi:glucose/mannose-6-phosphate isomerase
MQDIFSERIKYFDREDMLEKLLDFPFQIKDAKRIGENFSLPLYRDFKNVLFCGLGGSAIGGDLVRSYLYLKSNIPVFVNRDYFLPFFVDKETLVFISSYSGNTEETISSYKEAKKKKAKIIVISSGGALKDLAKKDRFPYIQIPSGLLPRLAIGYLSIIPLVILDRFFSIGGLDEEIEETFLVLEKLREELKPETPFSKNQAKKISNSLFNKFLIIYTSSLNFECCATRFRTQIAENSKSLSSVNLFPELDHNEIEGLRNPKSLSKNCVVVILRDEKEHLQIKRRIEITKRIIKRESIEVKEIWSRGKGLLARIFSLIYFCDFISFYLAILNKTDPTPVERIEYLKRELAKR